jgi:hypothetical protein
VHQQIGIGYYEESSRRIPSSLEHPAGGGDLEDFKETSSTHAATNAHRHHDSLGPTTFSF